MLTAIELFCCAGGMALGFRRAGIEFAHAVDFGADACDSYERNLGHRPIQMDVRDLLRLARSGWRPAERLDLLVADPPCTPWSRAGKRRGLADDADMLRETCALIAELRPTCWLIGNVPGLDDSNNSGAVAETIGAIPGYDVDFLRLNASSYGVPQHRVRPFWFGRPRGSVTLRPPAPSHGDPRNFGLPGIALLPWVTCRDALQHLSLQDLGRPVRVRWKRGTDHKLADADSPAPTQTQTQNTHSDGALLSTLSLCAESLIGHVDGHPPSRPDSPAYTITTGSRGGSEGGGLLLANPRHPNSKPDEPSKVIASSQPTNGAAVLEWPWAVPATTITQDDRIAPPGRHEQSYLSGPNAVVLSERARAILQGFPEDWFFAGKTKVSRSSQIGMAMPPAMAEAVAREIVRWFAAQSRRAA